MSINDSHFQGRWRSRLVGLHRRHRPEPGAVGASGQHEDRAPVIETAFSDEEQQLARVSRHLCPTSLRQELGYLNGSVDVHITHIKPGEIHAVMDEVARLDSPHRISALEAGQVMRLA